MKFVPLLGEILKELALKGKTQHNIDPFKITRPGVIKSHGEREPYPKHGSSQLREFSSGGGH